MSSLTLVVAGCGHAKTRIPLDGAPQPTVQVSATRTNANIRVTWSTSSPTPSAFVTLSPVYCHVADVNEHVFGWPSQVMTARVTAFVAPTDVVTDLGHATIWRGGTATATVQ